MKSTAAPPASSLLPSISVREAVERATGRTGLPDALYAFVAAKSQGALDLAPIYAQVNGLVRQFEQDEAGRGAAIVVVRTAPKYATAYNCAHPR